MLRFTLVAFAFFALALKAQANYVGGETQYFNPTANNLDFFTVHSSRNLPKGTFKSTLFFDFAENIHYSGSVQNKVNQAQLAFALGLTERLSFSLAGSGILNYDGGSEYTTDKFTRIRTNVKYSFCNCSSGGFALIATLGYGLVDPDYFVGDDNDFSASLTLAYDKMVSDRVRLGANLGYRYRNSNDTMPTAPTGYAAITTTPRDGSDILLSLGMNVAITERVTGVTELYASLPTDQFFDFTVDSGNFDQKGAEVLLGANINLAQGFDLGVGGTVGVFSNAQNADWRAFLGLGYAFGGESEDAAFNVSGSSSAPAAPAVTKQVEQVKEAVAKEVKIEDAPILRQFNMTAKFPTGKATLTPAAKAQLKGLGEFTKNNKFRLVFIEGHSDSRGSDQLNKLLSQRRAQAVKNYLVRTYNLPVEKVEAVGFGETAPIADNSTAAGRAKNRRVVIKVK